jgi:hypothetical protein
MSRGAACPDEPPIEANQHQTRCTASPLTPIQPDGSLPRAWSTDVQKHAPSCMIRASSAGVGTPNDGTASGGAGINSAAWADSVWK